MNQHSPSLAHTTCAPCPGMKKVQTLQYCPWSAPLATASIESPSQSLPSDQNRHDDVGLARAVVCHLDTVSIRARHLPATMTWRRCRPNCHNGSTPCDMPMRHPG